MKHIVDGIEACEPINKLINILIKNGYIINSQTVSDYHFKELLFELTSQNSKTDNNNINIDCIKKHDDKTFVCDCHWSRVIIK